MLEQSQTQSVGMPKAPQNGHPAGANTSTVMVAHIRLLAKRRAVWLRHLWAENEGDISGHDEIDAILDNRDNPHDEFAWYAHSPELSALQDAIERHEQAVARTWHVRKLIDIFGLSEAEIALVQACLALSIEPNLGRVYAYMQEHAQRPFVTEYLVSRLFGLSAHEATGSESPMMRWRLVEAIPGGKSEPARYEIDAFVRSWLLNISDLDGALLPHASRVRLEEPLDNWPIEATVAEVRSVWRHDPTRSVRVFVEGTKSGGKKTFSALVAHLLGWSSIAVSGRQADDHLRLHAQRMAHLKGCALVWSDTEDATWPEGLQPFPLQFVCIEALKTATSQSGVTDLFVRLPDTMWPERLRLWQTYLPDAEQWPDNTLAQLAQRHSLSVGELRSIADAAPTDAVAAATAIRRAGRQNMDGLAELLRSNFSADDLILPEWLGRQLDDFCFEAAERTAWWERPEARRLFPQGRGLLALFNGPSGTGKTMAAQVLAAKLGLDLYRIDLSTVVSKYVGETSKNLDRILRRAERMNAILFFDEADALFGKRTEVKDAHDRFANTDTNYLLQGIEQYPGIAVLASNKKGNIDEAFLRRLRFVLDFPKPDAAQRSRLWHRIVNGLCDEHRLEDADFSRLAEAIELTGAQIKLATLSAVFIGRRDGNALQINHLVRGIERELMKEGRGITQQLLRIKG